MGNRAACRDILLRAGDTTAGPDERDAPSVSPKRRVTLADENVDGITEEQLRELIDAHGAALTLYARTWCNFPDDALQEALIDLLRQDPFPEQPAAWLFTTVRRRAMNLTRGERCRSEHQRRAAEQRDSWFVDEQD